MDGPDPDTSWHDLLGEGRLARFALICLGVWLNAADALVVATIMPSVGAELGGLAWFGWATAGFFTGSILAGATAGRLSMVFGLRRAMAWAGILYALGCLVSAMAPSIGLFLAGRLVQGVGAGWIIGFAHVAIGLVFPKRHLARTFAAVASVWGAATLVGPLLGGLFVQAGDWRGVFWLFAVQALAFAAAAVWLLEREARGEDQGGVPALQVGLIVLAVAAIAASGLTGLAWRAAALGLAGVGLLGAAVRLDARAPANLFPRRAADISTAQGAAYGAMLAMCVAGMALVTFGPAILQALHGLSPLAAGYVIGAETLSWTISALLVSRAGPRWQVLWIRVGTLALVAALVWLTFALRDGPPAMVVAAALLQGAGFGVAFGFLCQMIIAQASDAERAVASSSIAAVQQTGAAVGAALVGAVATLAGASGHVLSVPAARMTAMWIFAAGLPAAALAIYCAFRLPVPSASALSSGSPR